MTTRLDLNPGSEVAEEMRLFQGCPTILCTPRGRLFAGWISGGTMEPSLDNYNLLVRSDDGGKTWSTPLLAARSIREEQIMATDIQLWLDPSNRMVLNWVQRDFKRPKPDPLHLSLYSIVCDDPDADELKWSDPELAGNGYLRCQPTLLSDGRIIRCDYDWIGENYHYSESSDGGKTWVRRRAGKKLPTAFDESMVLERKDGTLSLFARYAPFIAQCDSADGGKTWSETKSSGIRSPSSRFFIKRLRSGRILLVTNDDPSQRTNMTAFLSEDDGKTFPFSILLDDRKNISYPDAAEMPDGSVMIVYDRGRDLPGQKEILSARLTQEEIKAGKLSAPGSWLRGIISKAPEKPFCGGERYQEMFAADRQFKTEVGRWHQGLPMKEETAL